MADGTAIEWTDASWTPLRARRVVDGTERLGWHCEHASPGCEHCYSESFNRDRFGTKLPFKPGHRKDVEIFVDEKMLLQPLRWQRPRRIFVCSMTDLFGEFHTDELIDQVFAVMALCPQHTFQVLTKRSARMREYLTHVPFERISAEINAIMSAHRLPTTEFEWPLPNVWLGVSVEDQRRADERIPDLLATPAAVRFLSCEPLLGPVDLDTIYLRRDGQRPTQLSNRLGDYVRPLRGNFIGSPKIDWVIVGGESGPRARPMHPDWARVLRDQCAAADVPFFFKQWGEWHWSDTVDHPVYDLPHCFENGMHYYRHGKKRAGRLFDGVTHDGMPAHG